MQVSRDLLRAGARAPCSVRGGVGEEEISGVLPTPDLEVLGKVSPTGPLGQLGLFPTTVDQSTRTTYGWGFLTEQDPGKVELIAFAPPTS